MIIVVLLIIVYYMLDPEKKKLDESERKKLGGTYVNLSDGFTHHRLTGPVGGKVVVLVHGGTVPIWTWDSQIKILNDAGFRVLSYDHYG
ncbi:MAG: alpha/beta hydrolase, partial [Deltaproteobacteria bacterium]|nr:alpha/beta hydrolase [Deltaproteobacteria bacterium]